MNQKTYAIAVVAIFGYLAVSTYFSDRADARERRERLTCIHAHGVWADIDPSMAREYACVFTVRN